MKILEISIQIKTGDGRNLIVQVASISYFNNLLFKT